MDQTLNFIPIFFLKKYHLKKILPFYRDIFINWKCIQIEDNPVCLTKFAAKNTYFLSQIFEGAGLKSLNDVKIEYNLTNVTYFQWLQPKHAILRK